MVFSLGEIFEAAMLSAGWGQGCRVVRRPTTNAACTEHYENNRPSPQAILRQSAAVNT